MKVAILVNPGFRDPVRVRAYVAKLAGKYPGAVVVSAGAGGPIYSMEDAALQAGLRVASFRHETARDPEKQVTFRNPDDESPHPLPETKYKTVCEELRPGSQTIRTRDLPGSEQSGWADAVAAALRAAVAHADEVVVFSDVSTWPMALELPDTVQRIGGS